MPCNCSGSYILGRLQKLSYLQKFSTISKSGLAAYNDHVQNTAEGDDHFDSLPFYYAHPESWSAPSLRTSSSDLNLAMTSFPLQRGILDRIQTSHSLPIKKMHTAAAMKASPAFLKTKQLFEDDRRAALEQVHSATPVGATAALQTGHRTTQVSTHAAQNAQQPTSPSSASPLVRSHSDSSANSVADSVSSYHGYAGVNYQSGIKDIDDVPNQWGYSLNDYRAVFGEKYVHGCVPWEDEHISKQDRKKFDKLHSRRVQLLQELHGIEKGIRELML